MNNIFNLYKSIKTFVKNASKSGMDFDEICRILNGYNNDDTLFDFDIDNYTFTVNKTYSNSYELSKYFAIDWKDGFEIKDNKLYRT